MKTISAFDTQFQTEESCKFLWGGQVSDNQHPALGLSRSRPFVAQLSCGLCDVGQILAPAKLHQEVSPDEVWDAGAELNPRMTLDQAGWLEPHPKQHLPDLLQRRLILQSEARQTRQHVVQGDNFAGAVLTLDPHEKFRWGGICVRGQVHGAPVRHAHLLGDVFAAIGQDAAWRTLPQRRDRPCLSSACTARTIHI